MLFAPNASETRDSRLQCLREAFTSRRDREQRGRQKGARTTIFLGISRSQTRIYMISRSGVSLLPFGEKMYHVFKLISDDHRRHQEISEGKSKLRQLPVRRR